MGRAAGNRDPWWGQARDRSAAQVSQDAHDAEGYIPFEPVIVAQTDEFFVVDKPPFLPSTPNGRIVANTVQERLRRKLGEPEIVAVHRLDMMTSGLLLLSRNPETRGAYQQLFQDCTIEKEYQALTVMPDDWAPGESREIEIFLHDNPGKPGVKVVGADDEGARPARTTVTFLGPITADIGDCLGGTGVHSVGCSCGSCGTLMQVGHWRLQPHTGRTHQLRATMDWLDYPILGEDTYGATVKAQSGNLLAGRSGRSDREGKAGERNYALAPQLRLLAAGLSFTDPITGDKRSFRTGRDLYRAEEALSQD